MLKQTNQIYKGFIVTTVYRKLQSRVQKLIENGKQKNGWVCDWMHINKNDNI